MSIYTKTWKTKGGQQKIIRLYTVWRNMRSRCYYTSLPCYRNYGGRGIRVCPEWSDFDVFREWAIENGYRNGLTLDRRDNDGNYSSMNCRWVGVSDQAKNRRPGMNGHFKLSEQHAREIKHSELSLSVLALRYGVCHKTVWNIKNEKSWKHL